MLEVGEGRGRVTFLSLVKKDEEVFTPWFDEPLPAAVEAGPGPGPDSPSVMILQRVRESDESVRGPECIWGRGHYKTYGVADALALGSVLSSLQNQW